MPGLSRVHAVETVTLLKTERKMPSPIRNRPYLSGQQQLRPPTANGKWLASEDPLNERSLSVSWQCIQSCAYIHKARRFVSLGSRYLESITSLATYSVRHQWVRPVSQ